MCKFDYYELNIYNFQKHNRYFQYIHTHTQMMHYLSTAKIYNDFLCRYKLYIYIYIYVKYTIYFSYIYYIKLVRFNVTFLVEAWLNIIIPYFKNTTYKYFISVTRQLIHNVLKREKESIYKNFRVFSVIKSCVLKKFAINLCIIY